MKTIKLGNIAIEAKTSNKGDKTGCKIVGLEHLTPSDVTLSAWSDDTNNSFTKEFVKGDVLFGRRRAYLKKAALAPFDGICSGDITVIRAKEGKVDPRLLPFIIQNDFLFEFAVGKSAGSLSPRVKWEHLKNFEISLPDADKQKELADTLWSINETKQAYLELIKHTDELVKSQFIEMIGTEKYNPHNYDAVAIGDLCKIMNGYAFQSKNYVDNGVKIIRITNVQKGEIVDNDPQYYPSELMSEFSNYMLEKGDLLISLTGNCGRVGLLPAEMCPAALNQRVACLKSNELHINKMFLFATLNMDLFEADCMAAASGSAQKNMSTEWLKKYKILLPPKEQQLAFAHFVEQSDKSKFELQDAIDNLDALSKKIIAENLIVAGKE